MAKRADKQPAGADWMSTERLDLLKSTLKQGVRIEIDWPQLRNALKRQFAADLIAIGMYDARDQRRPLSDHAEALARAASTIAEDHFEQFMDAAISKLVVVTEMTAPATAHELLGGDAAHQQRLSFPATEIRKLFRKLDDAAIKQLEMKTRGRSRDVPEVVEDDVKRAIREVLRAWPHRAPTQPAVALELGLGNDPSAAGDDNRASALRAKLRKLGLQWKALRDSVVNEEKS